MTGQLGNNSFKTFKSEDYESRIHELSNQVRVLRERLVEMEEEKASELEQKEESREHRE